MINDHKEIITKALHETPEIVSAREKQILSLRFGLKDGKLHTLEYVGDKFGITRERVRQIESKCADRIRLKVILDC